MSSSSENKRRRDEEDPPSHLSSSAAVRTMMECAVCLQSCVHPARLDCGHIFCFLCIKGVSHASMRCPMCRRDIRPGFLEDPAALLDEELEVQRRRMREIRMAAEKEAKSGMDRGSIRDCVVQKQESGDSVSSATALETSTLDDVRWYYEGRNGWWQYDDRTSIELETFHARGNSNCELLIAGFLYIINFEQMLQYRRSDPSRRRRILRDRVSAVPRKGIAGIRSLQMGSPTQQQPTPSQQPSSFTAADANALSDNLSQMLSIDSPSSPQTPPPEVSTSEDLERLRIRVTTRSPTPPAREASHQRAISDRDGDN